MLATLIWVTVCCYGEADLKETIAQIPDDAQNIRVCQRGICKKDPRSVSETAYTLCYQVDDHQSR